MPFALDSAYGFGLVLLRTAGLFVSAPILSARTVPVRIRLSMALLVSLAVFTGAGSPHVTPPTELFPLAAAALRETAFGLLGGLAARWVLEAAAGAGQLAGLPMGIGFGSLIEPNSGIESSAIGELLLVLAQASAVAMGIHREAIAWLAHSARAFPPGTELALAPLAARAIGEGTASIALAIRLAFPVLAAVTFGNVAFGFLGRTAPQLNLSSVGFSVAVLAGGLALYLVAPAMADLTARAAVAVFAR
jgi:flagellar biosynthetic protein FliR